MTTRRPLLLFAMSVAIFVVAIFVQPHGPL